MKKGIVPLTLLLYLHCASALWAQAFTNLDFESANVSNLPPNQAEFVSVADGLPGWSAYIGTNQLTMVGHNAISLGAANVGVLGPTNAFQPLQGNYSAILQPGAYGGQGQSASIAQIGLIPSSANSVQFLAALYFPGAGAVITNSLAFTVGNQSLPIIPLGGNLYGCDISSITGSVQDISFTINDNFGNDLLLLDAITFSMESIPEPSTLRLVMIGIAAFGLWHFTRLGASRTARLSRR